MQVSLETTGTLERRLTITVENAQIDEAVKQRLQNLSRTVKLKGFRTGKVPLQLVKQHYGSQVQQEVLGDVMQRSFYQAIQQEKLRPAGYPSFEAKSFNPGEGLKYTATFEIYPEIATVNVQGIQVEKPQVTIDTADVDEMIETIRKQQHTWQAVDRAAAQGERATIDFSGSCEDKPIAGGQGKGYTLELGKGRMIPGFEEGLIGMKPGEEKALALKFPDTYHAKELAGKPATFQVKMIAVEEPVPPSDEVLAERLGVSGDVAKMRAEVQENMQRELDTNCAARIKQSVLDGLLQANTMELPKAMIEAESQHLAEQMATNLIRQGMPAEQAKLQPAVFNEQAKRRVALGLILAELIKAQSIKAEAAEIRQKVEALAAPYEKPQEVISWYYADKQRLAEIESLVLEEKVVAWVISQAKVQDKPMSFAEIMKPQK